MRPRSSCMLNLIGVVVMPRGVKGSGKAGGKAQGSRGVVKKAGAVSKGARTSADNAAAPMKDVVRKAAAVRAQYAVPEGERAVHYVGRTGHLWTVPPEQGGVLLDFGRGGMTKPYYPAKYAKDAAEVAHIDEWMNAGGFMNPTVEKYGIAKVDPNTPVAPLKRWDELKPPAILVALEANFEDDHDKNMAVVEAGIRYELSKPEVDQRDDLLEMLNALLEGEEQAEEGELDIEIELVDRVPDGLAVEDDDFPGLASGLMGVDGAVDGVDDPALD